MNKKLCNKKCINLKKDAYIFVYLFNNGTIMNSNNVGKVGA